jgi:hypothetical protein
MSPATTDSKTRGKFGPGHRAAAQTATIMGPRRIIALLLARAAPRIAFSFFAKRVARVTRVSARECERVGT